MEIIISLNASLKQVDPVSFLGQIASPQRRIELNLPNPNLLRILMGLNQKLIFGRLFKLLPHHVKKEP